MKGEKYMDQKQFAESYLLVNGNNFPNDKIFTLKEKLLAITEDQKLLVQLAGLKSPTTVLILSLFLGTLSIDRFYLGDIFLGILKIVSVLFFGIGFIWVLLDIYLCYQHAKHYNFEKIMSILQDS
ncbi:TM2 domain-containing protein [Pasteurella multocida]|nr:TM2 domain-containing protein [Pasteurella multocida]